MVILVFLFLHFVFFFGFVYVTHVLLICFASGLLLTNPGASRDSPWVFPFSSSRLKMSVKGG